VPKLTKRSVESADVREKPYFLFDDQIPGFCVRVSPGGRRHYYLQYMKYKSVKRISIGQHGIITAERARDKALAILADIKDGGDPQGAKEDKLKEPDVREISVRYMDEHVKIHCKKRTIYEYQRYLDKHILPMLGSVKISEVTRKDIANFHHKLRQKPYEANRCLEVLSKMFNLAEMWGFRPDGTNPRKHIKKFPELTRERYLTQEETKRLGNILQELVIEKESISAINCIRLLFYTGCRLMEIQTLKWNYIDWNNSCLRLPDSKTGAKVVYVGPHVIEFLHAIQENNDTPKDNPYVIYGTLPGAYLSDMQKPWRRIRKRVNLEDVRIHDLRHSFASYAVSNGMSLAMIGKLLGHTQVQTTARYAHLMADSVKEAASNVSGGIVSLMRYSSINL